MFVSIEMKMKESILKTKYRRSSNDIVMFGK